MTASIPVVLTFAGSDPTGGAGLQADILTLAGLGCHPLSVVTAVTVQDTVGVTDFLPLDPVWIADQARGVLEDMPVAAFKIGMLGSVEAAAAIAEIVSDYPDIPLVLDPVLSSGRGDEFANEELISVIKDLLLPQTTLITPNSVEARRLAQDEEVDEDEGEDGDALALDECGERLLDLGCEYVLITGAHEQTALVTNRLYGPGHQREDTSWERLPGSYHGSGCTLASAIAALLSQGMAIDEAVKAAQEFTYEALRAGYRPGMGQYLPDRLFWARTAATEDEDEAA